MPFFVHHQQHKANWINKGRLCPMRLISVFLKARDRQRGRVGRLRTVDSWNMGPTVQHCLDRQEHA